MVDSESRRDRTRFLASEIGVMILLLLLGEFAGVGAAIWTSHSAPELSRIFATAAITLFFGSLLGGIVTLLIGDFDRRRVQRSAQLDFISNVLTDLKSVHDEVDSGRRLIKAHQSAKTYGEQMRALIGARVKLQNVERALRTDERSEPIKGVHGNVAQMERYLRSLLQEYEDEYKTVSLSQSVFESNLKRALDGSPALDLSVSKLPTNEPWQKLEELNRLQGFLLPVQDAEPRKIDDSDFLRDFLNPLDVASERLRAALAAKLSSPTDPARSY